MARPFRPGDKVVPSPKKMPRNTQILIGSSIGIVKEVGYYSLEVQYDGFKILGRRDEFNRHRGS